MVSSVIRVMSSGDVHRRCRRGPRRSQRLDQPARDLQHHRVVGAHRPEREGRHQDVVRLGPVRLVVVGGEQPVRGELPHVLQSGTDMLGEPRLVGELGDQVEVTHEQGVPPVQPPHEHRPVVPAQFHDLLQRGAAGSNGGDVDDGDTAKGADECAEATTVGGMARQLPFVVRKSRPSQLQPAPGTPRTTGLHDHVALSAPAPLAAPARRGRRPTGARGTARPAQSDPHPNHNAQPSPPPKSGAHRLPTWNRARSSCEPSAS